MVVPRRCKVPKIALGQEDFRSPSRASTCEAPCMRADSGGDRFSVTISDTDDLLAMVSDRVLHVLPDDQADRVCCFANVAEELVPGGQFVLECPMPDVTPLPAAPGRGEVGLGRHSS